MEYGTAFQVNPQQTSIGTGAAVRVFRANGQRWCVILSANAAGGLFWGINGSITGASGMSLSLSGDTPFVISNDRMPGLPQQEIWIAAMAGTQIGVMEILVLPKGIENQSPQTALKRMQGLGIIDESMQRTGPVATPEQHIVATLSRTSPILAPPPQLDLESYNAQSRALASEVDAVRRTMQRRNRRVTYPRPGS